MPSLFDAKFGEDFLSLVPASPGVYYFWDNTGQLIYVGKAAVLRTRLSQYRRARAGEKAHTVVQEAKSLTWEVLESDLAACLRELDVIQQSRPKQNTASAFSFLYPLIGVRQETRALWICFTTLPDALPSYQFHGAFRSRETVAEAFFGLTRLFRFLGHPEKTPLDGPDYTYCFGYRRLPETLGKLLEGFLRGESPQLLEVLFHRLLNHAGARAKAANVKEDLRSLRTFWQQEALPLQKAILMTEYRGYPVPQNERDPLFLRARHTLNQNLNQSRAHLPKRC